MPYVICQRHGGGIAPHGCRHVAERIWRYEPPGSTTFIDLDGFFFTGWVCDHCFAVLKAHGLEDILASRTDSGAYPSEETLDPLLDLIDLQPMCAACFRELYPTSDLSIQTP